MCFQWIFHCTIWPAFYVCAFWHIISAFLFLRLHFFLYIICAYLFWLICAYLFHPPNVLLHLLPTAHQRGGESRILRRIKSELKTLIGSKSLHFTYLRYLTRYLWSKWNLKCIFIIRRFMHTTFKTKILLRKFLV